eukprot:14491451-Alexandrium_andersonii.AAC.1
MDMGDSREESGSGSRSASQASGRSETRRSESARSSSRHGGTRGHEEENREPARDSDADYER